MKATDTDPIVYADKGPARTAARLLAALDAIEARMGEAALPAPALHGPADRVTEAAGATDVLHLRPRHA